MRDPESGWIRLHPAEFFLIWSALDLGEVPAGLGIPHIGRTPAGRARLVESASHSLAERDLGTVAEPARDLATMLRALARPELALDLHVEGDGFAFHSVSADGPLGAVSAGVAEEELRIGSVRRPIMVMTMFDALAPAPAGKGNPANVRVEDYLAACAAGERDGVEGFKDVLQAARVRPAEIHALARALTQRTGGGQFGASVLSRSGRWTRTPTTVNWVDTPDGRYALQRNHDWVTVTPVDPARLRGMAEELVADLAG